MIPLHVHFHEGPDLDRARDIGEDETVRAKLRGMIEVPCLDDRIASHQVFGLGEGSVCDAFALSHNLPLVYVDPSTFEAVFTGHIFSEISRLYFLRVLLCRREACLRNR